MWKMLKECYCYKSLIYELVSRDIKVRYRRSVLGLLWTMLIPIMTMLVMALVFSQLFRYAIENYVVYLLIGNICFSFFQDSSSGCVLSMVENSSLIKKVYIPKCLFPMTRVFSGVVNFFFAILSLFIVMLVTGTPFHAAMLFIPIVALELTGFTMGIGMLLSTYTVFFRDITHLYSVFTVLWMYATPIFYPVSLLQENAPFLLQCNPMFQYIDYFRKIVLEGSVPGLQQNLYCLIAALAAMFIGLLAMSRKQNKFILYI